MKFNLNSIVMSGLVLGAILSFNIINVAQAQVGDVDTSTGSGSDCVTLDNNMRYRMRDASVNGEVTDLQDYLISENYLSGQTTGYFGAATLKAVKSFQSANGLLSSGYVGPVTRAKIKSLSCGMTSNNPNPDYGCTTSLVPYYKYNANTKSCYWAGAGSNGCYQFKPDEYATEEKCKTANGLNTPSGIMCTMEARLCSDGTVMPRDNSCGWHPEQCRDQSGTLKVNFISSSAIKNPAYYGASDITLFNINLNGYNFNQISYLQEEHLVDGQQTITRSQFTLATDNQISFNMKVCQGCKYTSTISAIDKNGLKSNSTSVLLDNTVPEPANALKAQSAILYNTNTTYTPNQVIKFSIQGYDSNGQVATPAKGFNVQWHMYDYSDNTYTNHTTMINGVYQGDNAVFNYNTNMWDITAIAPSANLPSGVMRKLEASFYCSNTSLGCYSSYENQIDKSFMFSINGSAQTSIKAYNGAGNEITSAGPIYTWQSNVNTSSIDTVNSLTLNKVNITKGAYQSIEVKYSCGATIDSNNGVSTNFAVNGTFSYGGGSNYFNCPTGMNTMKGGGDDVVTVANIVKDNDVLGYTINDSETWHGGVTTKNQPVGELYFYGVKSDGIKEFIKSIVFLYSIKG